MRCLNMYSFLMETLRVLMNFTIGVLKVRNGEFVTSRIKMALLHQPDERGMETVPEAAIVTLPKEALLQQIISFHHMEIIVGIP